MLLRNGITYLMIPCDNGHHYTDPRASVWLKTIEERAARDGLRVGKFAETAGAGSFAFPGVWLLRPDGRPYPFVSERGEWISNEGWEQAILPAMD
jgi:hypothetical protein